MSKCLLMSLSYSTVLYIPYDIGQNSPEGVKLLEVKNFITRSSSDYHQLFFAVIVDKMYRLVTVIRSVSQSRSMVKVSSSSFRVMTPSMLKSYTTTPVRLDITKPEVSK